MANKNLKKKKGDLTNSYTKVRYPKNNEFIGIVEKRLGCSRMTIRKMDGTTCMATIPGRMRKFLWIREGNIVLLKPWEIEKEKSDLIYKFSRNEIKKLEREGILKNLEQVEEF
jgi:translation initiation factor 1A